MGRTDFSEQFRKVTIRHKHTGYNLNVMRQSACLVIKPFTFDNFATLFLVQTHTRYKLNCLFLHSSSFKQREKRSK